MYTPTALHDIIPPIILPLGADGSRDVGSLQRQRRFLLAAGVHGILVNGSAGEVHALETDERAEVVRMVVEEVAGRVPVIAHVADTATHRALLHVEHAQQAGADYIAAVAPYYADFTPGELVRSFEDLARASQLPLLLYNLPQMVKTVLPVELVLDLARRGVVVGLKDTAGDFGWYRRVLYGVQTDGMSLRCFMGVESLIDVSLLAGGHGSVCTIANVVPHHCLAIYNAAMNGDWTIAATRQQKLQAVLEAVRLPGRTKGAAIVATVTWLLKELGTIDNDTVAPPLEPLSSDEQRWLHQRALPLVQQLALQKTA